VKIVREGPAIVMLATSQIWHEAVMCYRNC